jgi:hypothetical protein
VGPTPSAPGHPPVDGLALGQALDVRDADADVVPEADRVRR